MARDLIFVTGVFLWQTSLNQESSGLASGARAIRLKAENIAEILNIILRKAARGTAGHDILVSLLVLFSAGLPSSHEDRWREATGRCPCSVRGGAGWYCYANVRTRRLNFTPAQE